jgi:hypothetical protein
MSYYVTATRWAHGWELHIDGVGVTQSNTLADAEGMVRDYLELDARADADTAEIVVTPDLGGVEAMAREAHRRTVEAQQAQRDAAKLSRDAVLALRALGLTVADTAVIMGVTKGRISQLTH